MLFPHLPRDQRKSQLSTIKLVLIVSLMVAATMGVLMLRFGK